MNVSRGNLVSKMTDGFSGDLDALAEALALGCDLKEPVHGVLPAFLLVDALLDGRLDDIEGFGALAGRLIDWDVLDGRNDSPLHLACSSNGGRHLRTARMLLACGASVDFADSDGFQPIHMAAMEDAPEHLALLVSAGAGVNAANRCVGLESPLVLALRFSCVRALSALLALGVDLDVEAANGMGALAFAKEISESQRASYKNQRALDCLAILTVHVERCSLDKALGNEAAHPQRSPRI